MKRSEINIGQFIHTILKILNAKPNKQGIKLPKTSYVGDFSGEILTVTIERGDKLFKK